MSKSAQTGAGRGAIVRELRDAGHVVIASDIADHGFPLDFVGEFLEQQKAPAGCQAIVTNPPFDRRILTGFISHALDLAAP